MTSDYSSTSATKKHSVLGNFLLFLFFAAILSVSTAQAQAQTATSVLQGVVTDENKAIIPEAKLVLRDENGAARETVSDADGNFSFGELPFGKYRLTVEKEGFAAVEREMNLNGTNGNADLTLAAGAVNESVTIVLDSAEAAVESTLKLPVSIHETPRSVTAVGEERIREQNFGGRKLPRRDLPRIPVGQHRRHFADSEFAGGKIAALDV